MLGSLDLNGESFLKIVEYQNLFIISRLMIDCLDKSKLANCLLNARFYYMHNVLVDNPA